MRPALAPTPEARGPRPAARGPPWRVQVHRGHPGGCLGQGVCPRPLPSPWEDSWVPDLEQLGQPLRHALTPRGPVSRGPGPRGQRRAAGRSSVRVRWARLQADSAPPAALGRIWACACPGVGGAGRTSPAPPAPGSLWGGPGVPPEPRGSVGAAAPRGRLTQAWRSQASSNRKRVENIAKRKLDSLIKESRIRGHEDPSDFSVSALPPPGRPGPKAEHRRVSTCRGVGSAVRGLGACGLCAPPHRCALTHVLPHHWCADMCTCMTCVHVHVHRLTHTLPHTHTHLHTCTCKPMHAPLHTCTQTCVRTHISTHMHMTVLMPTHKSVHTQLHTQLLGPTAFTVARGTAWWWWCARFVWLLWCG